MNRPRPLLASHPGVLAALCLCLPLAAVAAESPYSQGEIIEIQGVVTDALGTPQAGRAVVLEVYRRAFDLRSLNFRDRGHSKQGLVQRTTTTDGRGRYLFRWPWHDYYNRFEVSVGRFGDEGFEVQERTDLSQRILRGSPVTVSFTLGAIRQPANTPLPRQPAAGRSTTPAPSSATTAPPVAAPAPPSTGVASSGATSPDQRDVQAREGAPDKVDTLELPYGREVTWWYFAKGRAYRFLDGELSEELPFSPVRE
jgi:hypothetical protein